MLKGSALQHTDFSGRGREQSSLSGLQWVSWERSDGSAAALGDITDYDESGARSPGEP